MEKFATVFSQHLQLLQAVSLKLNQFLKLLLYLFQLVSNCFDLQMNDIEFSATSAYSLFEYDQLLLHLVHPIFLSNLAIFLFEFADTSLQPSHHLLSLHSMQAQPASNLHPLDNIASTAELFLASENLQSEVEFSKPFRRKLDQRELLDLGHDIDVAEAFFER